MLSEELESHIGLLLLCLSGMAIGGEYFLDGAWADWSEGKWAQSLVPAAIIGFSAWGVVKNSRTLWLDTLGDAERDYDEREGDDDPEPEHEKPLWRSVLQLTLCLLLAFFVALRLTDGWDSDTWPTRLAYASIELPALWYAFMAGHNIKEKREKEKE